MRISLAMADGRAPKVLLAFLAGVTFEAGLPAHGFAQAWLPPKGEVSFSIGYGNVFVRDHTFANGDTFDDGHIRTITVGLSLSYGLSDRFAFDFAVPYVSSKYSGGDPHVALDGTTIDDGNYHGTFQDYQFALRFGALREPFLLTPYVAAVIPSHHYRYFAHSAVGHDLRKVLVGFFAARRLDPLLENGYVQLRYSYAFVQKVVGISQAQSTAELSLGYFVTSALGVRGLLSYGYTHGGLSLGNDEAEFEARFCDPVLRCDPTDPSPYWQHHDQIGREVYLNAGAGPTYRLTDSIDLFATYFTALVNRGGHKISHGLSFGVSFSFSPQQPDEKMRRALWGKVFP
jgi:hypothetical protein